MTSQMIAAAQRTIVVADSSKFATNSFARIGPLGSMQVLITDKEPPDDLAHALAEARVEVIIAPQEFDGAARLRNPFTNLSDGVKPAYKPFLSSQRSDLTHKFKANDQYNQQPSYVLAMSCFDRNPECDAWALASTALIAWRGVSPDENTVQNTTLE
jgi:DeoR C terminal sensor domain